MINSKNDTVIDNIFTNQTNPDITGNLTVNISDHLPSFLSIMPRENLIHLQNADKVWREGLIFKLRQIGICGNSITLMENYLSNRKQRVVSNGTYSDFFPILSGVPQGSVLATLLFLIYINDLEKDIKSTIKFFADDAMLYSVVNNPTLICLTFRITS